MAQEFTTYCGLDCNTCTFREPCHCGGCIATQGHPFHGGCEVAECAKSKGRRFCGECEHIPCEILTRYSFDEKNGDNGARIENCNAIKTALVKEARAGIDPISCCGFHCDGCFMGQWCGGCRSSYNICSFATLYEDNICPNVSCSKEKKLDGCYECPELEGCEKGYYSKKDEYFAKATALFIRAHGKEAYDATMRYIMVVDPKDPGKFDATGSVDGALALLEKFWKEKP